MSCFVCNGRRSTSDGDVYKVHFKTPNWLQNSQGCNVICYCHDAVARDPPLLFNIARDPSEDHPLSPTDPENAKIIDLIRSAVDEHRRGVEPVPSQFSLANLVPVPWRQPCCNFPDCDCIDPVYADLTNSA